MLESNMIEIETTNKESHFFLKNSGIILSKKGIEESSQQRLANIEKIEATCSADINRRNSSHRDISAEDAKKSVMKQGLTELIIEVTNSCNLRCTYCVFGEKYGELRKHGFKNMSFETAQKAIDNYLNLLSESKITNPDGEPVFSFYGGEPLLNYDLIKKCVGYIRSIYKGNTFITLTSNATLLTDDILKFFKENSIYPIFSLDGGQHEHDAHRVFRNNTGSFEKVYKNLKRAREILGFPPFINAVYSYDTDLRQVVDFFSSQEDFVLLSLNMVSPINTSFFDEYSDEVKKNFFNVWEELKNEFYTIVKQSNETSFQLMERALQRRIQVLDILFSRQCMNLVVRQILNNQKVLEFTGTCTPGERIFVDVDGNYHICEKISRSRSIGNVTNGLDFKAIAAIMNEYYRNVSSSCISCGIKKACPSCFNNFLSNGNFSKDEKTCSTMKNSFIDGLTHYCHINELNCQWLDRFRSEYYRKAKELVVTLR